MTGGFGDSVAHVIGRQHDVALAGQQQFRAGQGFKVAGRFALVLERGVLVTQHRAAGTCGFLRQHRQRRGQNQLPLAIKGLVVEPPRLHRVFGASDKRRVVGCRQRSGNVTG